MIIIYSISPEPPHCSVDISMALQALQQAQGLGGEAGGGEAEHVRCSLGRPGTEVCR